MKMQTYKNTEEYINNFSEDVQKNLQKIREVIKKAAPEAEEKISYGIPTFKLNGKNLVHFAAYDTHYALYPGSTPIAAFTDKLKDYETAKGTIRFPLDKPLPLDLIRDITQAAAERNMTKKKS